MKKIFTPIVLLIISFASYAQQDPQFSQHMFNRLYNNPAYAGSNDAICASLIGRNQWMGFDGAPKTGVLSADMPVPMLHGGVGISVAFDKLGYEQTLGAKLAYAFRFNLGSGKLALGAEAGLLQKSLDGTKFVAIQTGDAYIPGNLGALIPDFGFGAFYNTNKLYFGFSTTHLSGGVFKYGSSEVTQARHFYIMGGYSIDLNPTFTLKPSLLVKSDQSSTIVDINTNLMYNNQIWLGASYRVAPSLIGNSDAIVVLLGMDLSNYVQGLKFGYSYDITTSNIRKYSSGSHEIMLGYCMKSKSKPVHPIKTVRFL